MSKRAEAESYSASCVGLRARAGENAELRAAADLLGRCAWLETARGKEGRGVGVVWGGPPKPGPPEAGEGGKRNSL